MPQYHRFTFVSSNRVSGAVILHGNRLITQLGQTVLHKALVDDALVHLLTNRDITLSSET